MVANYRSLLRHAALVLAGLATLAALIAHAAVNARAAGDYRALGVLPFEYRWQAGQLWIDAVPPDLARDSGLQPADRILRIEGEPVGDSLQPGHLCFWRALPQAGLRSSDGHPLSSRGPAKPGPLLRRGQKLALTVLQNGLIRELAVPLGGISPSQAHQVTRIQAMMLPKQLAGFCLWLLGALVLLRRRDRITRLFFLWCMALALYTASSAVAVFLWDSYPRGLIALFRTGFTAGWFFAPALFGHFCRVYATEPTSGRRLRAWFFYAAPLAALLGIGFLPPAWTASLGRLLWLGLATSWLATLAAGLATLFRARARSHDPIRRKQIRIVLTGSLAYVLVFLHGFVAALAGWDADPATVWAWLPHVLLLLTPAALAYAILRHRLMDLDVLIRRSLVLTLLTIFMGGLFVVLQQLAGALLQAKAGATSLPAQTIAAMLVAALFGPAERHIVRFVEALFNRRELWRFQQLQRLGREIQLIDDPSHLEAELVARVLELFEAEHAALFRLDPEWGEYRPVCEQGRPATAGMSCFHPCGSLAVWLNRDRRPLDLDALQRDDRYRRLDPTEQARLAALGVSLCVPLCAGGRLAGFLTLGPRSDHDQYSREEKEALLALGSLAAAALRQAELERRVRELERERVFAV